MEESECRNAEGKCTVCRYAEGSCTACHYSKCRDVECHGNLQLHPFSFLLELSNVEGVKWR
jgi:hypothetical protein